ncbi:MAG: DUF721 domain-containing protein [Flavobacteriales bacterium]|nr:DUF721 domain-containing protein [Flavobacteriales bacterium]
MSKRSNELSLGEAIQDMVRELGLQERLDAAEVVTIYDEVVGPLIARHTRRVALKRGTLIIEVDSSPLRQEISYLKEDIRSRINERMKRQVVTSVTLR